MSSNQFQKDQLVNRRKLHIMTILAIGISASLWAVGSRSYTIPISWLFFAGFLVIILNPDEIHYFLRRFARIGTTLIFFSLIQILFRRSGDILLTWNGFPLIFSDGLREAILLWVRFMILFVLAKIFAQISLFEFILFLNKIKIPLQTSLLLSNALKLIPFIFSEARRALWFLRFRGIELKKLSIRNKFSAISKLIYPLLMRGIHYTSFSALALESRGYGSMKNVKLSSPMPITRTDILLLIVTVFLNSYSIINY